MTTSHQPQANGRADKAEALAQLVLKEALEAEVELGQAGVESKGGRGGGDLLKAENPQAPGAGHGGAVKRQRFQELLQLCRLQAPLPFDTPFRHPLAQTAPAP